MPQCEETMEAKPPPTEPNPTKIALPSSTPSWFTPKRLLVVFCVINLINYVDRGAIASNGVNGTRRTCKTHNVCTSGSGIQGAFNLTNAEDGFLSSAFMVGFLVATLAFAQLAKRINPFRLVGVGLSVWTLAVVCCGFSFNFWFIIICRMLVGVGEASFICLAPSFIVDYAPANKKTFWLGIFYACISTGSGLGYIYGGLVGGWLSWRYAFFIEAILMLPFAILGLFIKPLQLKGFVNTESKRDLTSKEIVLEDQDASAGKSQTSTVKEENVTSIKNNSKSGGVSSNFFLSSLNDIRVVLLTKVFVVNVLGYVAYNFVIGAYQYWGPKAGKSIYHMKSADYIFGGIIVVSGILGTLAGGYILDKLTSSISNAFKLLTTTTLVGAIACFGAFCFRSMYGFLVLFAIGLVPIFATQGPVNFTCLHCVVPSLRPTSMAISTIAIHLLGDVPSSPLVGKLQDHINNWRETALILTAIFFVAAAIWFIGIFLHSVDKSNEEGESQEVLTERSSTMA